MLHKVNLTKLVMFLLLSTLIISCSGDSDEVLVEDQNIELQESKDFYTYDFYYQDKVLRKETIGVKSAQNILDKTHWVVTKNNKVYLFDSDQEAVVFLDKLRLSNNKKGRSSGTIIFSTSSSLLGGRTLRFNNTSRANIPSNFDGDLRTYGIVRDETPANGIRFYNFPNLNSLIQANPISSAGTVDSRTSSFEFRQ
ncbi:hypothetical protein [uncultured Aquimarina sp.]|uniref:hypothetical protein n=1 Tax=uncultured Aquimarina sp. TaxID=575652 RepID=UPI0026048731|nr:hypothetical protein [uncultured Aquimarina sp.]